MKKLFLSMLIFGGLNAINDPADLILVFDNFGTDMDLNVYLKTEIADVLGNDNVYSAYLHVPRNNYKSLALNEIFNQKAIKSIKVVELEVLTHSNEIVINFKKVNKDDCAPVSLGQVVSFYMENGKLSFKTRIIEYAHAL